MTDDFPVLRQTVIDTADPRRLAEFYRQLLGYRYRPGDEGDGPAEWLVLLTPAGERALAFQLVRDLPRPVWPDGDPPQMMHLDTAVHDEAALERHRARAQELGATLVLDRSADPDEPLYVLADPAGHPFCLFFDRVPDAD